MEHPAVSTYTFYIKQGTALFADGLEGVFYVNMPPSGTNAGTAISISSASEAAVPLEIRQYEERQVLNRQQYRAQESQQRKSKRRK